MSAASAAAPAAVTVPLPVAQNFTEFNRTARHLLAKLHKKYPTDLRIIKALNALNIVAQASPSLPATRFFNEVYTIKLVLPAPVVVPTVPSEAVPERETKTVLELLRAGNYEVFCQPAVIAQFKFLKGSQYTHEVKNASPQLKRYVWEAVKKLALYSGHPEKGTVTTDTARDLALEGNVAHFNAAYDIALNDFCVAFPCAHSDDVIQQFRALAISPDMSVRSQCLHAFKKVAMTDLTGMMQNPLSMCESPALFLKLPFFCALPLREYWQVSILQSEENMERLAENLHGLLMASTGLHNLNANLLETMMAQTQAAATGISDPNDAGEMRSVAMALFKQMQADRGLEGLKADLQGKMPSMDTDLLQQLVSAVCPQELSAMQGGLMGALAGSTGAPAFGDSAPHPAWMTDGAKKQ